MSEMKYTNERLRQIMTHDMDLNADFLSKKPVGFKKAVQENDPLVNQIWNMKANDLVKAANQAGRKWSLDRTANRDYLARYVKSDEFKQKLSDFISQREHKIASFLKLITSLKDMKLTVLLNNGHSLELYPFFDLLEELWLSNYVDLTDFHKNFVNLKKPIYNLFHQGKSEWFESTSFKARNGSTVSFKNSSVVSCRWNFTRVAYTETAIFGLSDDDTHNHLFEIVPRPIYQDEFFKYHIGRVDLAGAIDKEMNLN